MLRSSITTEGGTPDLPDYIYYNADIINNTTADLVNGTTFVDPPVRFNETRDTALVKDASQYHFSIVRFTMDGANKDLPLFIPDIQEGTGQTNVNLTSYAIALTYQQTWNTSLGPIEFSIRPNPRFVLYTPETQNPSSAPLPAPTSAPQFQGFYVGGTTYFPNDVVTETLPLTIYGTRQGPFYRLRSPNQNWNASAAYQVDDYVNFNGTAFRCILAVPPSVNANPIPPAAPANWVVGVAGFTPSTSPQFWTIIDGAQGSPQDLSSRYYWVYTYEWWLHLVNTAISDRSRITAAVGGTAAAPIALPLVAPFLPPQSAIEDLAQAFYTAWVASGLNLATDPFPFATLDDFVAFVVPPTIVYEPSTNRFTIKADSDGYGTRITTFTPQPYAAGPPPLVGQQTPPVYRIFFNTNMYGLFTNFKNIYWNTTDPTIGPFANTPTWSGPAPNPSPTPATPVGYTNEIIIPNKWYQNIEDYRLPPYAGIAPLGVVPTALQKVYWLDEQDYESNSSLWSPISSVIFTSTLLPIRPEQTGPPIILGQGNDAEAGGTAPSAFQPIITDIALPMNGGAADYRSFIYYAPSAEYRLSDTTPSKQDIRSIDVQVFWKNRLNNEFYPVTLFNLSSVSLKCMFRHKNASGKAERTEVSIGGRRY